MFCPRCGNEIKNNQRFCTNCGYDSSQNNDKNEGEDLYKKSYYKHPIKKDENKFQIPDFCKGNSFALMFKGILITVLILASLLGISVIKRHFSLDLFNLDKSRYENYMQDPASIPELTQPETLEGFIKNVKDVQDFLALYLKYSDDTPDKKTTVFNDYRTQLVKMEAFTNENLLKDDFRYSLPQTDKEFKKCARHYDRKLKCIGMKIVPDMTYSKYHLTEDARFTYKKYGSLVDPQMGRYLALRAKHHKEFLNLDYLNVKPKEMNARIADYENFLNANTSFSQIKEVQDWLYCYTIGYVFVRDREDMKAIRHNTFKKADKKFTKKYKNSKLVPIFSKMVSSANGISQNQFNEMYPYEYEKMLDSLRPADGNLDDIFASIRKDAMQKLSNIGFRYVFSTDSGAWETFNDISKIGKDCLLLADNGNGGYDVYDSKFKKTNQTLVFDSGAKIMLKRGSLLIYTPVSLQISRVEYFYGSFNTKVLSSRAIKEYFPNVLIINVDNIGSEPVQITKDKPSQAYMLISPAGINFTGYHFAADGPVQTGELSNIFTINSTQPVTVQWTGSGQSYSMTFVTSGAEEQSQDESATDILQQALQGAGAGTTPTTGTSQTTKQVTTKPATKTSTTVKPTLKAPAVKPAVKLNTTTTEQ